MWSVDVKIARNPSIGTIARRVISIPSGICFEKTTQLPGVHFSLSSYS